MSWAAGLMLICGVLVGLWLAAEVISEIKEILAMRRMQRKRAAFKRYCEMIDQEWKP